MGKQTDQTLAPEAASFLDTRLRVAVDQIANMIARNGVSVPVLTALMGQFAEDAARLPVPEDVACKKGCAFCCHTRVSTSIPEVLVIADILSTHLSIPQKEDLLCRMERLIRSGAPHTIDWWAKTATPCPFLADPPDSICTIYDIRPFTCRSHHSLCAADCKAAFTNRTASPIPCYPVLRRGVDLFTAAFIIATRSAGLFAAQVAFIPALFLALQDPSAAERWMAGEELFFAATIPQD